MSKKTVPQCWQYLMRKKNLTEDLKSIKMSCEEIKSLRVSDFNFSYVGKDNKRMCQKIKDFIVRHEWLGTMPHRPTHRFVATWRGHLAGVVIMATPNTFCSRFFGPDNRDREKLISRGACASWTPKNLGSALIMYSIHWMAKNTHYRFFTAYSDTEAGELGTIYQACNFIYLGQKSGDRYKYFDHKNPEKGWFSDRRFRKFSQIKIYVKDCGFKWSKDWELGQDKINWDAIPHHIEIKVKETMKKRISRCLKKKVPRKHKYVYILGANKRETTKLRWDFIQLRNPSTPYPRRKALDVHAA